MSMSGLQCKVWQPQTPFSSSFSCSNSIINSFDELKAPEFLNIDFYVSSSYYGEDLRLSGAFGYKYFRERCRRRDWTLSWSTISSILSQTNVPFHLQPFFIQHISLTSRQILLSHPHNLLSPNIPIFVHLILPPPLHLVDPHPDIAFHDVLRDDDDDDDLDAVNCVICLDDISIHRAVRMPCLHVYHRDCIRKWLQLGKPCPLCRFSIFPK